MIRSSVKTRRTLTLETLERRSLLATVTTGFEDLSLSSNSYWNGPDPAGTNEPDPYGGSQPVKVGSFKSGGISFFNEYNPNYGSWGGFAYSNQNDTTTPGFGNQFSSYAGGGHGDANFGVGFGYYGSNGETAPFDPTNLAHLKTLPAMTLPVGAQISSAYVTNGTYPALDMLQGSGFAEPFGGPSGDEPDWFKLSAYGTDAAGNVVPGSAEIYLADYRFSDNSQDYILDDWALLDLSALVGARKIYFNVTSSDMGSFGMNTPGEFLIDAISYTLPHANRAPVLDNSLDPTLGTIAEDATNPASRRVSALLAGAVSDPDAGAERGIAITGAGSANHGTWQYTVDGGENWSPLGVPSPTEALLLNANLNTRVRFIPNANFHGQVKLFYRAWDQTRGTPLGTLPASGAGNFSGSTSLSAALESAVLTIRSVNDRPILGSIEGSIGYKNSAPGIVVSNSATVSDVDGGNFAGGKLLVRVSDGSHVSNRIELGGALFTIDANNNVVRRDAVNGDKIIGTLNLNGGRGFTKFEVAFNANATVGYAQQLVRALRFRTENGNSTSDRTLSFSLFDGDGGVSDTRTKTVLVS